MAAPGGAGWNVDTAYWPSRLVNLRSAVVAAEVERAVQHGGRLPRLKQVRAERAQARLRVEGRRDAALGPRPLGERPHPALARDPRGDASERETGLLVGHERGRPLDARGEQRVERRLDRTHHPADHLGRRVAACRRKIGGGAANRDGGRHGEPVPRCARHLGLHAARATQQLGDLGAIVFSHGRCHAPQLAARCG